MPGNFTGRCHRPILPTETRARRLRLRLTAHVTRLADDAAYRGGILPALPAGTGGDSASALLVPCPLEPAACPARSPCTSPNVPAALRRLHQSGGAIWPDKQPERLLWRDLSRGQGDLLVFWLSTICGAFTAFFFCMAHSSPAVAVSASARSPPSSVASSPTRSIHAR